MPSSAPYVTNDVDVGERLRLIRTARRCTLREVAERAGLSESFLSQVERGRTSASIASSAAHRRRAGHQHRRPLRVNGGRRSHGCCGAQTGRASHSEFSAGSSCSRRGRSSIWRSSSASSRSAARPEPSPTHTATPKSFSSFCAEPSDSSSATTSTSWARRQHPVLELDAAPHLKRGRRAGRSHVDHQPTELLGKGTIADGSTVQPAGASEARCHDRRRRRSSRDAPVSHRLRERASAPSPASCRCSTGRVRTRCQSMFAPYVKKYPGDKPQFTFMTNEANALAKIAGRLASRTSSGRTSAGCKYFAQSGLVQPWDTTLISNFKHLNPFMVKAGQYQGQAVGHPGRLGLRRDPLPHRQGEAEGEVVGPALRRALRGQDRVVRRPQAARVRRSLPRVQAAVNQTTPSSSRRRSSSSRRSTSCG